jgi:hypothetical protein
MPPVAVANPAKGAYRRLIPADGCATVEVMPAFGVGDRRRLVMQPTQPGDGGRARQVTNQETIVGDLSSESARPSAATVPSPEPTIVPDDRSARSTDRRRPPRPRSGQSDRVRARD